MYVFVKVKLKNILYLSSFIHYLCCYYRIRNKQEKWCIFCKKFDVWIWTRDWIIYRDQKETKSQKFCLNNLSFNPIQHGLFLGCSQTGGRRGGKKAHFLKSATHPTMIKLGTVIPYLKKIQKIYAGLSMRPTRSRSCRQACRQISLLAWLIAQAT